MTIMNHAVEGQDSNLINNRSNTEEIEYNCDKSINQSHIFSILGHTTLRRKSVRPSPMEAVRLEPQKIDSRPKSFAKLPVFQKKSNTLFVFEEIL